MLAVSSATYHALRYQPVFESDPLGPILLGSTAGVVAQSVVYPLDTLRRRLQVRGSPLQLDRIEWRVGGEPVARKVPLTASWHSPLFPSLWKYCREVYRLEGGVAFYRGMVPNMLKTFPAAAVQLVALEWLTVFAAGRRGRGGEEGEEGKK